jgi:DNA primase catalytic core
MGLHKLTAGDGYTYLTRQVAVHDATDRGHSGLGEYYSEKGESPGTWWGTGLAALDMVPGAEVTEQQMRNLFGEGRHPDAEQLEDAALDAGASLRDATRSSQLGRVFAVHAGSTPEFLAETSRRFTAYNLGHGLHWRAPVPPGVRARIRTELADELFNREHGRGPLDDRERAGFLARATRQQTTAVAGYDLTFTPVKTVSTLWAVADPDVAQQVEQAHRAAVEQTLAWLEENVLFTRRGRAGVQQVKATGLIAAVFTHRDARSSDPHLHTHVAVSNKVQDGTGRWLAVDGRVLYKANVTLSEMYNTLLEGELVERLGVRFTPRPTGTGPGREKRPVREIAGIDERLARTWSRRRVAIEARRRELTAAFQTEHGRPPTAGESVALGKQAWSQTRQAKHAPRSEADQRTAWRAEAVQILGSEGAVQEMVDAALGHRHEVQNLTDTWVERTAAAVVEAVQAARATWQVWHLRAEASRRARTAGIRPGDLESACDQVVAAAINQHCIAFNNPDPLTDAAGAEHAGVRIPAVLTRADGASVYSLHGARLYTSPAIVDAERRILAAAQRLGGWTISGVRVGIAVAESAANGITLTGAQQTLVRQLGTSGRHVQLALAPAGTGKTTALRVLTRAWADAGGTVIGLAPSAVAAEQLSTSINPDTASSVQERIRCDTLAKLVWHLHHGDEPAWMRRIDDRTMVLIDEAGMAATTDLAEVIDHVTTRGGSVRLIGDDRQLASIGAGGVLRDIAHQHGAVTLTEVRRFLSPDGGLNLAEAAATLAVRDGDPAALGFYADHGRIHVGDLGSCADQAYAAWATDHAAGDDSVLLAPTRELVAELNTRARNDRLNALAEADPDHRVGRVLSLGDGTQLSAGDPVITRRNDRMLAVSGTDWVKNGDRWTASEVHDDGSVTVTHKQHGRRLRLPAEYLADHVQLGYATTVHGAQGITTGTCHVVLAGTEDRNLLYVALSRGRYANHLYLAIGADGDPHNLIRPETLTPPTALDKLADMLRRDGSPVSATTALRDAQNPASLLHAAAERYHDALTTGAEHLLSSAGLEKIDRHAGALMHGLTDAPAWPTLRSHLALLALEDHNPLTLLTAAVHTGPLDDAQDPAAVLDARIDRHIADSRAVPEAREEGSSLASAPTDGPLPWLPGIPNRLADDLDWGPYLTARHQQVVDHTKAVTDLAKGWTPDNSAAAPAWARSFLEPEQEHLRAQLTVWRAAHDTPDTDLRPTGERAIGTPGEHQAELNRAVRQARPGYPFAQRNWYQHLPETVRADPWITPLCQRLARLERAGLPVDNYLNAATNSGPLPDEYQAAALWWRLVLHLGPTALDGDAHTADLLTPTWTNALAALVGTERANYLRHTPAWPALVAAVDEACRHHDWTPHDILTAGLTRIPQDGSLTGAEVADALQFGIARLTDPHPGHQTDNDDEPPHEPDHAAERGYGLAGDPSPPTPPRSSEPEITAEEAFPDPGQVANDRILALNQQALAFYQSCYHRSWAPDYLRGRLGTDLSDHPTFTAGYAPPGPRSLLTHLTSLGATVYELEQAGLVRTRERRDGGSEYVDVFRDRLIMPIRKPEPEEVQSVIGFIGRRNPTKTDHDYAGPKYLNTKNNVAFTKREALFGYAETRDALASGALPVIVEGPIDAYAITLGSGGTAVGLAPMGTALTTEQIKLISRHIRLADARNHIAIATDADPAGWKAAQTAFWNLTAADLDPTHIALPDKLDPADVLRSHGPDALQAAIGQRASLGDTMLEQVLRSTGSWADPPTRKQIVEEVARILAARGPDTWTDAITRLNRQLQFSPGILEHHTVQESITRDHDPAGYAQARVRQLQERAHTGVPPRRASRSRTPNYAPAADAMLTSRAREARTRETERNPPRR